MTQKLKTKNLKQTKQWLTSSQRLAISEIIQASFSHVEPNDYMAKYFDSSDSYERKLRLYYDNEKLVGYCLLTFSAEFDATIIRASAAFFSEYRKGSNTFQFSLYESVKSWLSKPWQKHYYADTMLSPAMYRAIAKNTGLIWPHFNHKASSKIFNQFNKNGKICEKNSLRCLLKVDRVSNYSQKELDTLRASTKPEIKYYCHLNPDFNKGMALFIIIPVNIRQLLLTIFKRFGMVR